VAATTISSIAVGNESIANSLNELFKTSVTAGTGSHAVAALVGVAICMVSCLCLLLLCKLRRRGQRNRRMGFKPLPTDDDGDDEEMLMNGGLYSM
jgi:hypothetical protein